MRAVIPLVLLTGCATNFANPLESEDPFEEERPIGAAHGVEGELVEYEVRLRGILVGRVQVAVGNRGVVDGRPAVVVRSRAVAAGTADLLAEFRWELTTTIDIDTGCALDEEEDLALQIPGKDRVTETSKRAFSIARSGSAGPRSAGEGRGEGSIDSCHRNPHSAAGSLRGWRSQQGATAHLPVHFDRQLIDVNLTDAGREMVGSTPAVRYEGTLRGKHEVTVWISDEEGRVPLRMRSGSKLGDVDVTLVSYEVPRDH